MDNYTEAVNTDVSSSLEKSGMTSVSDSIREVNNKSSIFDMSNIKYTTDRAYITKLIESINNIKDYQNKVIYIPVNKWYAKDRMRVENAKNPLGALCRYIKQTPKEFKTEFADFVFIFYNGNRESFPLYVNQYKSSEFKTIINLLEVLVTSHATHRFVGDTDKSSPVKDIKSAIKVEEENLDEKKKELVDAVSDITDMSASEADAMDMMDDEYIKRLIVELEEEDDGKPKFNAARTARMSKLNDEFMKKKVNGKSIEEIITKQKIDKIPTDTHLKVSSINDEDWENIKFTNFQKVYDINADILKIIHSFSGMSYPISIIDVKMEDTSTNMDYINTYTVSAEDGFGKRFTLVFDVPKFINNRFMKLRGNEKVLSGQLLLLPCIKTDEDTVQCVSNYNKIFIYKRGANGKSLPYSDRLIKALKKYDGNEFKVQFGDNKAICSKYELPIDYIDLASQLNKIETKEYIYYFNQDVYYSTYKADSSKGIPYAITKTDNSIIYYKDNDESCLSQIIASDLWHKYDEFKPIYLSTKTANRLSYSEAKILSNFVPLVVILGYSLGMNGLKRLLESNKRKEIVIIGEKRASYDPDIFSIIKFSDGYIRYPIDYSYSMLLNGLSACPTENYSIADLNSRSMWLDFLDVFGGRILSDGLDNFADLFMDPITKEVCEDCGLPTDYFNLLLYANDLLVDNKYNRHTDISGNRYRTNEIIAGYVYNVLAKSYVDYKLQLKHGRKVGMTIKRSAVIDAIFKDPMSSDLSILNPLLEIESANTVSFMGLSGMNSKRSYSLDKRTYDDSMVNKLALSTGFAANVGISRQTTIDMDVEGKRGYINKTIDPSKLSTAKSFSMTEAIVPFGTTRDDPFRSAMTFIQTSKHSMRTKKSMPLLITNGADEAIPFISSDTFAYKAKANGEVTEITDDMMVITYNTPIIGDDGKGYKSEAIDLKNEVKKNSDGGFYITLKLDTDLKVGSKFKEGDILAYDKTSFSSDQGEDDNLAYNAGVLAKIAIMNTDEGFEDSTSISPWLSEAMATDVVVEDSRDLSKNTNVYSMVKVGQEVQEGEPLLIFQNSFDEKDANILLKNITDKDSVSDLGRIRIKSKYTGVVQDIKIYRTCEIDDMSDSLKKIVMDYEKHIKAKKKMYKKYNMPGENILDPDYKLPPTGIMKNNADGVKIVFYIKYFDKLSVGDKTVAQSANKGVVKDIFPEGLEPFSEYRPNESIHALYAARSFNARMVTSVWVSGAINKCMIELDRQVKEIMGLDYTPLEEM